MPEAAAAGAAVRRPAGAGVGAVEPERRPVAARVGVLPGQALGFLFQGDEHDLHVDAARHGQLREHGGGVLVGAAGVGRQYWSAGTAGVLTRRFFRHHGLPARQSASCRAMKARTCSTVMAWVS